MTEQNSTADDIRQARQWATKVGQSAVARTDAAIAARVILAEIPESPSTLSDELTELAENAGPRSEYNLFTRLADRAAADVVGTRPHDALLAAAAPDLAQTVIEQTAHIKHLEAEIQAHEVNSRMMGH